MNRAKIGARTGAKIGACTDCLGAVHVAYIPECITRWVVDASSTDMPSKPRFSWLAYAVLVLVWGVVLYWIATLDWGHEGPGLLNARKPARGAVSDDLAGRGPRPLP
jgi:hypothetical protein